jgi:GT2 family glycosyltransferase
VIDAGANLGFAAGNNVALRAMGFRDQPTPNPAGPRAVLLLNPDTLTTAGAITTLMSALFNLPRAGVVGAQLAYEDGSFQHGAFQFPSLLQILIDLYPLPARLHGRLYESRWNGRYPRRLYTAGTPFEVDHTLGATMLLRREAIEQTGLFDEQFFMYCEEVDWSKRIRAAGWAIYAVPQAHITHLEGRSAMQIKPQSVLNLWTSRLKFYRKHYASWQLQAARWLVRGGMAQQIRKVERMATLSPDQRAALIDAYRRVQMLFRKG